MLKLYSRVTMQWQDQATDELEGNDLIGAGEEGVGEVLGEVLEGRGGYRSGLI